MISYDFVPISSQKGVLFFETPGIYQWIHFHTIKLNSILPKMMHCRLIAYFSITTEPAFKTFVSSHCRKINCIRGCWLWDYEDVLMSKRRSINLFKFKPEMARERNGYEIGANN